MFDFLHKQATLYTKNQQNYFLKNKNLSDFLDYYVVSRYLMAYVKRMKDTISPIIKMI